MCRACLIRYSAIRREDNQLEVVADLQTNCARLNDELPITVAVPVLKYASIIAPVTAREAASWGRFVAEVLTVQHGLPTIANQRQICANKRE